MAPFELCVLTTLYLILLSVSLSSSLSTLSISETSGQALVCALNHQSHLRCKSFPEGSIRIPVNQNLTFSGVVAGDGFVCALQSFSAINSSVVVCWRFSINGSNMLYKRIFQGPEIEELRAGNSHVCGIVKRTKRLVCWQWPRFDSSRTIQNFSSIAVGDDFVCGLSSVTGNVNYIEENRALGMIQANAPNGNFSIIAAGFRHACAITMDNDVECWGETEGEKPAGKFIALAVAEKRSCVLRLSNGTVACWGSNNFSLPERLKDTHFIAIEAKRSIFCGVTTANYSVYCWGDENLNSNSAVFEEEVQPGPCRTQCPCGPLLGSGVLCGEGREICQPCSQNNTPDIVPVAPRVRESKSKRWNRRTIAFLVIGCVGSLSLLLVIGFFLFKYLQSRECAQVHDSGPLETRNAADEQQNAQSIPVLEKKLSQLASIGDLGQLEEFSLRELLDATDGFSFECKIGSGSFGSVYRATMPDGRQVAAKRAEKSKAYSFYACQSATKRLEEDRDAAFIHELESLSRLSHKNLVHLHGFCEDSGELVLVYEYVDNATLHDHLHKLRKPLPWPVRIRIALDAAKGVEHLHEKVTPPIIHRDIKSSNILLDTTWTAKVSDFGLSLIGPDGENDESHLSLRAAGTVGYIDPEYYRLQQLTTKTDVYCFGVVLLEILTGRKAIHNNDDGSPQNVVDYAVPYIMSDEIHRIFDVKPPPPTPYEIEAVACLGYLAARCVESEGRHRPSMAHIVDCLKRALASCSTTRSTAGAQHRVAQFS